MDLDLVFFGTSGSVPTAQRAPSALLVRRGGERLLFDCGEGTQRQLLRSTVGLVELREVFVSHFHADHYLGLPGMLKTFALREHPRPGRFDVGASDALGVPPGPERGLLQAGESVQLADGRVVTPDEVLGEPRPGRKVVLSGDTAPSPTVLEAARGAEVLVHEATFLEEERERARETAHSTALEAAEIARDAEVGLLALTHLSNRYFGPEVAREARTIFPETVVPKDFDVIDVPFPERGAPQLVKGGVKHGREERAPEAEVVP